MKVRNEYSSDLLPHPIYWPSSVYVSLSPAERVHTGSRYQCTSILLGRNKPASCDPHPTGLRKTGRRPHPHAFAAATVGAIPASSAKLRKLTSRDQCHEVLRWKGLPPRLTLRFLRHKVQRPRGWLPGEAVSIAMHRALSLQPWTRVPIYAGS